MNNIERNEVIQTERANGVTLGEIAQKWGITKQRVQQICAAPARRQRRQERRNLTLQILRERRNRMNPSYGVIVGRFQVHELHEGHMELFRAVMGRHNRVIVFVGTTPVGSTPRNPLDFITRKAMIQAKFPNFTVLPLPDANGDYVWSRLLDTKIREVVEYGDVTLYGGRDSFMPHYKGDYKPVELNLIGTEGIKGEDIRAKLTNTILESSDFRAGVIYGTMNQRPRVITTVDVVIYYRGLRGPASCDVWLGRKEHETKWRFVGGHAEVTSPTFEADVRAEAMEEANMDLSDLTYIGSTLVPDWRWANELSKIKTLIFMGQASSLACRAGSDLANGQWFPLEDLTEETFTPTHRPLWDIVRKHFETGVIKCRER